MPLLLGGSRLAFRARLPSHVPRLPRWAVIVLIVALVESYLHWRSFIPTRALEPQDGPFATSCREPDLAAPRENAVLVMMARNSELEAARYTVTSVEEHFNRWYKYPIVFFNNEEFSEAFKANLTNATSAEVQFEVIPAHKWKIPDWLDEEAARQSMRDQELRGVQHAGREGYHHMCRFYSGQIYDMPDMQKYKWYWRLEPDTDFFCHITYDPFVEMARRGKVYGFTIALWELFESVPSLFRHVSDYKEAAGISSSPLWNAVVDPSAMPWPLRPLLMSFFENRDKQGDAWSGCHYWSNFEIGDMDFFRSDEYRRFFTSLDRNGGFYHERWGDAPVHSLALAMLLDPAKIHHFDDIGYRHDNIFQCPINAPGGQLPESDLLGSASWKPEAEGGIGCRCTCDGRKWLRNNQDVCLNRMTAPNTPGTSPFLPWSNWW